MRNLLRWSAGLTAMLLVLAACQSTGSPSPSQAASQAASAAASADAAAICAADTKGCVEVAAGDSIKFASANAITGDVAFLGNDINFGIQVAINDRGQLLGHDVELVKEDAGCGDAATGQTAAQAIVADKQIVAVVGTSCSRTAVPAMPVLSAAGVTMISPANTAPSLTNPDKPDFGGPFYFRTAYNDNVQGAAVAKFACEQLHAKTAATVHDGSPYAEQLQGVFQTEFTAQCGGVTTYHEAINIGDTNFHDVLTTIASSNAGKAPDMFFFPIFDPEGPLLAKQTADVAGLETMVLVGADGVKDQGFIDTAGTFAAAHGGPMYFSGPDLNFGDTYTNDFLPKYTALSGTDGPIAPYHAHGFDAINILMDAVKAVAVTDAAGTLWIPRDAVREYVHTLKDYPGLTGTLTCDANGDCGSKFVSIAQLKPDATTGKLTFQSVFTTRPAS
ncbi:MAG: branched-chain amino acid ABC transporter substrate-binding protein [Candidatus Limnocylindria bacterium]